LGTDTDDLSQATQGYSWVQFPRWSIGVTFPEQTMTRRQKEEVDSEYEPMYSYDPDAPLRKRTTTNVPKRDQIEALQSIDGEGMIEPEGWTRSYNEVSVPIINGVPILLLGDEKPIKSGREGAEKWTCHAVEDVGHVEVHLAGRHPQNVSKVGVKE